MVRLIHKAGKALEEIEGGSAPPLDSTRPNDAAKPEIVAIVAIVAAPYSAKNRCPAGPAQSSWGLVWRATENVDRAQKLAGD